MPKDLLTVETAVFQRDQYRKMFGDIFDFLSSVKRDLEHGWTVKARVTEYLEECGDHAQGFDFAVDNNYDYAKRAGDGCIELAGMSKAKADKLLHYRERDPKSFLQFDVFTDVEEGDGVVVPDSDGDSLFSGVTTELMTRLISVRVLVVPGTPQETVVRALMKVSAWIERDPDFLDQDKVSGQSDIPF